MIVMSEGYQSGDCNVRRILGDYKVRRISEGDCNIRRISGRRL